MAKKIKRLYRASEKNSMIGGVCAGIADFVEADPVLIRLAWALITLVSFGFGLIAYLIAWLIIPRR